MVQVQQYGALIRELPTDERPRERLRMHGPGALSNAELIAILLRTGCNGESAVSVAQRVLRDLDGLRGLRQATFGELAKMKAMGEAKAAQVLAAIELGKRVMDSGPAERRVITRAEDVYSMLYGDMALLDQEHLRVILLNTRNEVVAVRDVYKGNVNTAIVRPSEVFKDAVREGIPTIVMVHNHPSGDPSPSPPDIALTRQIVDAGRLLGIEVLDHVIIGRHAPFYSSLKEKHLGFQ
jgi:DNA repair protein RadC